MSRLRKVTGTAGSRPGVATRAGPERYSLDFRSKDSLSEVPATIILTTGSSAHTTDHIASVNIINAVKLTEPRRLKGERTVTAAGLPVCLKL